MDGLLRHLPDLVDLAIGIPIAQVRLVAEGLGDPTVRGGHADAHVVVLADEQDRHGQPDLHAVAGGVERRQRGGVVDRGIAKGARHDRVVGKVICHPQAPRSGQGEGKAHRLGEVAPDG